MTWDIGSVNRGKHLSEKTRLKISQSRQGIMPWNLNKHWPEEIRSKISQSMIGQSAWNSGHHWSDSEKLKRSLSAKAYWKRIKSSKDNR